MQRGFRCRHGIEVPLDRSHPRSVRRDRPRDTVRQLAVNHRRFVPQRRVRRLVH